MKKLSVFVAIGVAVLFFLVAVMEKNKTPTTQANTLTVAASFYPHAFVAQEVGGAFVNVIGIVPPGAEPHEYESSLKDVQTLQNVDVFIYNGAGIDSWAQKLGKQLSQKVKVVDISSHIAVISRKGIVDPHIWLDPLRMKQEATILAQLFTQLDPSHKDAYQKNREKVEARLTMIDQAYQNGLANCKQNKIITSHDAFGYLADRYDFEVIEIAGLSPEQEPSQKKLIELTHLIRKEKIQYVFFETLVTPKLSETLAQETNAKTMILDPIEGLDVEGQKNNYTYYTIMEHNLLNLKTALECQ